MARRVHGGLRLCQDDVAQKRLGVFPVRHVEEDRLGSDRTNRPSLPFHAAGRIIAPAPVSTSIPVAIDLSPSKRLVTVVCAMSRPIGSRLPRRGLAP